MAWWSHMVRRLGGCERPCPTCPGNAKGAAPGQVQRVRGGVDTKKVRWFWYMGVFELRYTDNYPKYGNFHRHNDNRPSRASAIIAILSLNSHYVWCTVSAYILFSLGLGYLGRLRLVLPFDSGSRSLSGSGTISTSNSIPLISNTMRDHPKGPQINNI